MNSLNFPDTNVWLALVWERHIHSETAQKWFQEWQTEQFLFCRFTQLALLRLLTNRSVMNKDVKSMTGAWGIYDRCFDDDRIAFLSEPEGIEPDLRSLAAGRQSSPQIWADAYLAAFARSAGLRLITFDKALAAKTHESILLK